MRAMTGGGGIIIIGLRGIRPCIGGRLAWHCRCAGLGGSLARYFIDLDGTLYGGNTGIQRSICEIDSDLTGFLFLCKVGYVVLTGVSICMNDSNVYFFLAAIRDDSLSSHFKTSPYPDCFSFKTPVKASQAVLHHS